MAVPQQNSSNRFLFSLTDNLTYIAPKTTATPPKQTGWVRRKARKLLYFQTLWRNSSRPSATIDQRFRRPSRSSPYEYRGDTSSSARPSKWSMNLINSESPIRLEISP
ncbi:hypothetical protein HYFRA_00001368 [Hymenoscyphus fraxineus]|uniref:Uncharacterized protein n=1 Tax=Hymenoscyphus fraxineus TaxID=746836 RepID=A0A9N9L3A6_9HELO|nr:hypothetical protein HYFRA_00001368 [Hymenoscyphus fraxineus]